MLHTFLFSVEFFFKIKQTPAGYYRTLTNPMQEMQFESYDALIYLTTTKILTLFFNFSINYFRVKRDLFPKHKPHIKDA